MKINEGWRNWAIIFALLIITGLITALWPVLTTGLLERETVEARPAASVPVEIHPIVLELPALPIAVPGQTDEGTLVISPFLALAILTGLVVGGVLAVGIPLAFIYVLLDRQRDRIVESEEFREKLTELEKEEKARLKRMNQERTIMPKPEHKMPRWSVVSTSIIILLFVIFFGMVINYTFIPEGELVLDGDRVLNSAVPIVGGLALITLIVLAWRIRPQTLESADVAGRSAIPWDFIAVLVTGLIVVGIGIAALVMINTPA